MRSRKIQAAGKNQDAHRGQRRSSSAGVYDSQNQISYLQVLKGERNLSSERDLPVLSPGQPLLQSWTPDQG